MFPSALNTLPATPVVVSHAATIFAFDVALLDDAADASDVARLDALDAAIATLALCVAALVEHRWVRRAQRYSSSAARQHTGNELDERSPSSAAWAMSGG
ncbi:hypothetical protein K523DRAFT_358931 [Schizophyllum commune Tattone D]|nr:hypothetical protein K523DRAFT_358931 [Schizophyllum commune Tattone D]